MLICNYSYVNQICGHNHSGITNPVWVITPHTMRGYYGGCNVTAQELKDSKKKDNFPTGGNIHAAYILSDKGGMLSATTTLYQFNTFENLNLAGGLNGEAAFDGSGDITAQLGALAYLITTISGLNALSSNIQGAVNIAADLVGDGDLTGALGALISILADLNGNGELVGSIAGALEAVAVLAGNGDLISAIQGTVLIISNITGTSSITSEIIGNWNMAVTLAGSSSLISNINALAHLIYVSIGNSNLLLTSGAIPADISCGITLSSSLSPENIAAAVWNSLAAAFNNPSTMGEVMNNVGAGADPWGTVLPGTYNVGEAGNILGNLLAAIPQSVWDELKNTHNITNSYGKIVKDIEEDLITINEGIKKASVLIPHTTNL